MSNTSSRAEMSSYMIGPTFAVSLAEHFSYSLHNYLVRKVAIGPLSLVVLPYVFCFALCLPLCLSAWRASDTRLASFCGFTIAISVIHLFRGAIYWPGVFDRAGESKLHLVGPVLLPLICGSLGRALGKPPKFGVAACMGLGLACLLAAAWYHFGQEGIGSFFAYTRPIAIVSLLVFLLAMIVWDHLGDPT